MIGPFLDWHALRIALDNVGPPKMAEGRMYAKLIYKKSKEIERLHWIEKNIPLAGQNGVNLRLGGRNNDVLYVDIKTPINENDFLRTCGRFLDESVMLTMEKLHIAHMYIECVSVDKRQYVHVNSIAYDIREFLPKSVPAESANELYAWLSFMCFHIDCCNLPHKILLMRRMIDNERWV